MKIGNIIIVRSAKIKRALIKNYDEKSNVWHRTRGIYQCRLFGLCIMHDGNDVLKVYNEIIDKRNNINL